MADNYILEKLEYLKKHLNDYVADMVLSMMRLGMLHYRNKLALVLEDIVLDHWHKPKQDQPLHNSNPKLIIIHSSPIYLYILTNGNSRTRFGGCATTTHRYFVGSSTRSCSTKRFRSLNEFWRANLDCQFKIG